MIEQKTDLDLYKVPLVEIGTISSTVPFLLVSLPLLLFPRGVLREKEMGEKSLCSIYKLLQSEKRAKEKRA